LRALVATAALVCCCVRDCTREQVFIVEWESSRGDRALEHAAPAREYGTDPRAALRR